MQLERILRTGSLSPIPMTSVYAKREENSSAIPSSWQNDTVSISAEAMAATQQTGTVEDKQEEKEAETAFGKYMDKALGRDGGASPSDPADQIKALREKVKKLSSQLEQIANESGVPESSKLAKMEAISSEINELISQIAALQAQMAKSGPN